MVNSQGTIKDVVKFQGTPLKLKAGDSNVYQVDSNDIYKMKKLINTIFANKPTQKKTALREINESLRIGNNGNLKREVIDEELGWDDSIVVTWGGTNDLKILEKLDIGKRRVYDITANDLNKKGEFNFEIRDTEKNKIILQDRIGTLDFKGRSLNLTDAHDHLCWEDHDCTEMHDPITDVMYTKCIFNRLMNFE